MNLRAVESRHQAAVEVGRKLQHRSLDAGDHNTLFASCSDIPGLLDYIEKLRALDEEELGLIQVGWMGPYGIIPGGMDNDPDHPRWKPIYMRKEDLQ